VVLAPLPDDHDDEFKATRSYAGNKGKG